MTSSEVLLIDDDRETCELLAERLGSRGFHVTYRTSAEEGLVLFADGAFDAVVTDINMRGMNGIEFCRRVAANRPDVPVVVITAFGSLDSAIAAMRAGAFDFVTKPFDIEVLAMSLRRAAQMRSLREEVRVLRRTVEETRHFDEILGASPAMASLFDVVARVADSDASVLIAGETGTGKELVARALHRRSPRRDGPFVAINCAALPETLLEAELFGHSRGAFTDAKNARVGLLQQASGGTLFLDEIGDMPMALQPKILRALQERTVRPVGGNQEVPIDVRVVSATHRDLPTLIEEKRFREDLLYRLEVIRLDIPPLRARGADVLVLAQHFVQHFATRGGKPVTGLSAPAAERLLAYPWPGNVRELQNSMERAVALARYEQIAVDDLPERVRAYRPQQVVVAADDPSELVTIDELERRYILRVMQAVGGNKSLAAQILGIERTTLYRKLERYARTPAHD